MLAYSSLWPCCRDQRWPRVRRWTRRRLGQRAGLENEDHDWQRRSGDGYLRIAVGCGAGTPFPLSGWWNNQAITFTVNWQQCNSLTAWTGHRTSAGGSRIVTLWYLAVAGPPQWNSTVAGTDTFTQTQ